MLSLLWLESWLIVKGKEAKKTIYLLSYGHELQT